RRPCPARLLEVATHSASAELRSEPGSPIARGQPQAVPSNRCATPALRRDGGARRSELLLQRRSRPYTRTHFARTPPRLLISWRHHRCIIRPIIAAGWPSQCALL